MNMTWSEKQRLLSAIQQVKADQEQQQLPHLIIPDNNKLNSDSSPIHPTTSPNHNYFNIKQFIPKRTSSSESNVSKMLEAFQPNLRPIKSKNPISPRISANDPEILSKLLGKRVPVQHALTQGRRIQVTMDTDMFIRLWIKEFSDANSIKLAILQKLSIDVDPSYFLYYHENGIQSTIPLTDEDLVRVCQTSDDNRTNRVLVVPVEGYQLVCQQKSMHEPYSVRYVLSSSPASTITGYQLSDPETPTVKTSLSSSELWAILPHHDASFIPPITTANHNNLISNNLPNPSRSTYHHRTDHAVEGISLYDPPTPRNDDVDFNAVKSFTGSLPEPPSPIESQKSDGSHEEDMFGERPSVEKLYSNIDRYLPGHDLDKEILVESTTPPVPSSKRQLGHRPSVRVVAKEAHRRWKQETKGHSLLRRKSTKMWGSKVERVKPGEEGRIVASDRPVPTKMQWLRGELIGKGSFGRVYHALNVATGEWIAVKQVDMAVTESDRRNQDLKEAVDALYREISLLKDLEHINIVQYMGYDCNSDEGFIYIFLEYVPGGSIASLLNQYSTFDEQLTAFFTLQILQGLEYLHDKGILHRDIKAGNVLIDQNGICKITDFGLSKNQNDGAYDSVSNNSTMKGTVFWMAPEVLTNNYSAKIDIWSLGCTVLEMLTGTHPWMHLTSLAALYAIGNHKSPEIPSNISVEAKDFLEQCFKIKPEDRPTAKELLRHPFVQNDESFNFKDALIKLRSKQ
ncbi:hypothetical protein G6F37_011854 [Rhizopus arrhizus]|nr:hypothetical protein G6F37_011854 [Rhizopus arrhizus]KAG1147730.1 hypothetical protein G6F38_004015 [Rhizopus arrhizus]